MSAKLMNSSAVGRPAAALLLLGRDDVLVVGVREHDVVVVARAARRAAEDVDLALDERRRVRDAAVRHRDSAFVVVDQLYTLDTEGSPFVPNWAMLRRSVRTMRKK